jgi:SnoaL-like domain
MSDLAEKDAIRELMAEYCLRLDNDRFAEMAALFTADGTWDTAFGKSTGHAGIEALVRRMRGTAPRPRAIHHVTNIVIKLEGTTAKCFSNWMTVQNSEQGPKIGSAGSYSDDLVKQDGRWLFRYRKIDRFIHD